MINIRNDEVNIVSSAVWWNGNNNQNPQLSPCEAPGQNNETVMKQLRNPVTKPSYETVTKPSYETVTKQLRNSFLSKCSNC